MKFALLWLMLGAQPVPEKPVIDWFYFARPAEGGVTKAYGPFTSSKDCRASANKLMPEDTRFQTNAQQKALKDAPKVDLPKPTHVAIGKCKAIK